MPAVVLTLLVMLPVGALAQAGDQGLRGVGTVTLVDGTALNCEVLFEHPNAPLLIVRATDRSTVQSIPLSLVQGVTVDGKSKTFAGKRALSKEEKIARERNGLWGSEAGGGQIGRYAKEKWEAKPLIVWAKPGESGDAMDAGSWLDETGAEVKEGPWRMYEAGAKPGRKGNETGGIDGDVLLPAAEKKYEAIQAGNRDHLGAFDLRHLTVEANASYRVRYTVWGNLWVKDGASLGNGTQTGGLGSADANKHTFARFCNFHDRLQPTWAYAPAISHWVYIDTGDTGSLEIIGESGGAGDRLTMMRGTLVISENSYIGNGNRGSFYTQPGTTAILLDGARVGCPDPLVSSGRATYGIGGTLLFGTKEHPLKHDLEFSACYFPLDQFTPTPSLGQRTSGASFVLAKSGRMEIHSADPSKARVIFRPRSRELPVSQYVVGRAFWQYTKRDGKAAIAPTQELWQQPTIPTGVTAVFDGATDFNGVVFDGFYDGGIYVDPKARAKWKNVSFGKANQVAPENLFKDLP